MLKTSRNSQPRDNKLRHCRDWLEATLLVKSDARTLTSAGLLAGEIVLFSAVGLWIAGTLVGLQGPPAVRLAAVVKGIIPWLPFLALCLLLSLAAAHMAQWGERRSRRGRTAAALVSVPVTPVILGILLVQPFFAAAPILAPIAIWAAAELWWQLFLYFLRRLATFDYWAELERESRSSSSDNCYDLRSHREYLATKKTALMERKLRWEAMANSGNPQDGQTQALNGGSQGLTSPGSWTRLRFPVTIILAACCFLALGGLLRQVESRKAQVQSPEAAAIPVEPPRLTFWYQALDPEASLLQDLIDAYNETIAGPATTPGVIGINQDGDLAQEIFYAQLADRSPDIMLLPRELGLQLYTRWNSPAYDSEFAGSYLPLWTNRPWRQRLALVVSPKTQFPQEAQAFAAYLHDRLSRE